MSKVEDYRKKTNEELKIELNSLLKERFELRIKSCLLYTSDAADD